MVVGHVVEIKSGCGKVPVSADEVMTGDDEMTTGVTTGDDEMTAGVTTGDDKTADGGGKLLIDGRIEHLGLPTDHHHCYFLQNEPPAHVLQGISVIMKSAVSTVNIEI